MIVGDWASADFTTAHMTFGKDYGCQMAPGNQDAYVMTVDVFVFPKTNKPDQVQAAQDKLAKVMMDPAVQTAFNAFKGALPARLDANIAGLDACAKIGAENHGRRCQPISFPTSRSPSVRTRKARSRICWAATGPRQP